MGIKNFIFLLTQEIAICDKIITTPGLFFPSPANLRQWLTEDMRMERAAFQQLDVMAIGSWLPKKKCLQMFVKTLADL
jgi:hypothetical protein